MRISDWSSECALPISSLEGMDVLLNASPLGMTGKPPLALSPAAMNRNAIIFDMVYAPLETPLLRQSRSLGFEAVDGLQMLVAQAAGAFQKFFGVPVPQPDRKSTRLNSSH